MDYSSNTEKQPGQSGRDPIQEIIIILLANRVHPSRKGDIGSKEMYGIRRLFYNNVMAQLLEEVASE